MTTKASNKALSMFNGEIKDSHLELLKAVQALGGKELRLFEVSAQLGRSVGFFTNVCKEASALEYISVHEVSAREKYISLSSLGEYIVAHESELNIIKTSSASAGRKPGTKNKVKPKPAGFAHEIQPIQKPLNLSANANNIITMMAQVAEENNQYRSMLLDLVQRGAAFLGLELIENNSDESQNEN